MAIWSDYLTRKLIFEEHPNRCNDFCLDHIQTHTPCHRCETICPRQVFSSDPPAWGLCDGCGLCVSVCPSRCIAPAQIQAQNLYERIRRNREHLLLSCSRQTADTDGLVPCLASLPWELIALAALNGQGVTFLKGPCSDCPMAPHMELFAQSMDTLDEFFGSEFCDAHIRVTDSPEGAAQQTYSRREAFQLFFSRSKQTAGQLLPSLESAVPDGTLWRQLLVRRLQSLPEPLPVQLPLPSFSDSCYGCTVCSSVCPSRAIHRIPDETHPDRVYLALIPWRCTGCGVCVQACPAGALSDPVPRQTEDLTRPLLHRAPLSVCRKCGQPLPKPSSDGLCASCRGITPDQLHW